MATTVALQPAASFPKERPAPISSKREFEQIISLICRKFAEARSIASQNLESLQASTTQNYNSQRNWHLLGNFLEIAGGLGTAGVTAAVSGWDNAPKAFEIGSKIGDMGKGLCGATQYSQRNEQEKIQYATTQWQTFVNGLQEAIRNLKAAQQRLDQLNDSHR